MIIIDLVLYFGNQFSTRLGKKDMGPLSCTGRLHIKYSWEGLDISQLSKSKIDNGFPYLVGRCYWYTLYESLGETVQFLCVHFLYFLYFSQRFSVDAYLSRVLEKWCFPTDSSFTIFNLCQSLLTNILPIIYLFN